tara:strand:+ start:267 stop:593 length:327 start_codon:yes stop_codon:yes gene_type:complete
MSSFQLPKNKFALLSINIVSVVLWLIFWGFPLTNNFFYKNIYYPFILKYLCWGIGKGEQYSFACQIAYQETFWFYFGEFIGIVVIFLITRYIWFGRIKPRPKITRSKD